MSDSGDPDQDEARLREEWERHFAPLCPGCGEPLDENHVGSCYGTG